ncbi:CDF family Co(II)/Ni(II) efflux transporter DmeF [Sphingosinicella humi]|uniref:Cation transporter n=1 Tax=Allosphingosinicella humi TaxID=2068657 RepID=A0A2U2J6K8_9SPHN|nr:CDF family Co(II)/Ni(II) efflux transporter DmeF [Sphingosinicella humi]PWG03921.1 cation transporter [Sphingosinicella humi]
MGPAAEHTKHRHAAAAAEQWHQHAFLGEAHHANERRTRWVVALTTVMMVGEIAAGWLTGSMALLADGFHMATHAAALAVAAGAYAFARRRAHDPSFAFGTGKVGDLAGFGSALMLAVFAIGIGVESIERLIEPRGVAYDEAIVVAVLGLLVNLASAWLLSDGHQHGHDHHHHHDHNLRSAYFHVLADALTSVLAILALLAGRYLGWAWLDAAVGIVGALVILRWSWELMRDTGSILLDRSDLKLADEARRRIENDGDARVTDLHIWRIAPGAHAGIVSLVADRPHEVAEYHRRLSDLDTIVHLSIEIHRCPGPDCR